MTWDISVTPVTQDIEQDMDHDEDSQRISRDRREQEEQLRRWICQCIKLTHSLRTVWSDVQTMK